MPSVQSQDNNISISVKNGTNAGGIRTANNQAEYWSEKSKQWAVGEGVIEDGKYSSKHYAESVSGAATEAVSDINTATTEANTQITNATSSAISQINEAKRQVIFGFGDTPVTYGVYTDMPMGTSNWLSADSDDTEFLAEEYPDFWSLLNETYEGDTNYDIKICTATEAEEMLDGLTGADLIMAKNKLAYYFIIDTVNATFKLPKCVDNNRCIGNPDIEVKAGESNHGGVYTTSMRGKYFECSPLVRLEKATKTVNGQTVTYHKATQWNDPTEVLTPEIIEQDWRSFYGVSLTASLAEELINKLYYTQVYIAKNIGGVGEIKLQICGCAAGAGLLEGTTTQATFGVPLYDGSRTDTDGCECNIPNGETESYLMYAIEGYTPIPDIADYNLSSKLWIKVM